MSGPLPETYATISLPPILSEFFPEGNKARVQFQFYSTDELFQVRIFLILLFYFLSCFYSWSCYSFLNIIFFSQTDWRKYLITVVADILISDIW